MPSQDLTLGRVGPTLFSLTAPMTLGISANIIVSMIEIVFIGQLGTDAVAAVTFTFPLTMALSSIALGISIGTSSLIARSVGGGDSDDVHRLGTHALILTALLSAVLAVAGWLSIGPLFTALGATESTLTLIQSYLDLYFPGVVLFTTVMIAGSIMRANGNAKVPGFVMAFGALLNLALDPLLIFGWFGFPRLEVAGAAAAMTISRGVIVAIMLWYVFGGGLVLVRDVWRGFFLSCKRILHIGIPAMATQLIGPVSGAIITRLLASHGENVVAGFGVATRIEAVSIMFLFALSGSIGPFVGQNWGALQYGRVKDGLDVAYLFCLIWGGIACVALWLGGPWLVALVDDNPAVVETAVIYLAIVPVSYGLWGVLMMASASFNALGKPLPSTALSFARMFVLYVPLAIFANQHWGYAGIFFATAITNCVMAILAHRWFKRTFFRGSAAASLA